MTLTNPVPKQSTRGEVVAVTIGTLGVFFTAPVWIVFLVSLVVGQSFEYPDLSPETMSEFYFGPLVVISIIMAALYGLVTSLFLQQVTFRGLLKYSYSLFVFPVFLFLSVVNMRLAQHYVPFLFTSAASGRLSGRSGAGTALLLIAPLGLLVCFVWYRLFALVDQALRSDSDDFGSRGNP